MTSLEGIHRTLTAIEEELDMNAEKDANLQHMIHMFQGYRARMLDDEETTPYSPGSARQLSFERGMDLADDDIGGVGLRGREAEELRKRIEHFISYAEAPLPVHTSEDRGEACWTTDEVRHELQKVLDGVDARDALKWLEMVEKDPEKANMTVIYDLLSSAHKLVDRAVKEMSGKVKKETCDHCGHVTFDSKIEFQLHGRLEAARERLRKLVNETKGMRLK